MRVPGEISALGFCLFALVGCTSSASERRMSDHFDGERFFNPTLSHQFSPGVSDIIQMMMEGRAKWPETVANTAVPRLNERLYPDDVAITFVNHATFLIQMPGLNVLTDPVWSTRASPIAWVGPKRVREPGVKFDDLPWIDVVVISHNHYDHLDTDTLRRINARFAPKVIVPVGDKALVESLGIRNVEALDWWEQTDVGGGVKITFAPAQHSSARSLFDRDRSLWGSYLIRNKRRSVYFGGDSG